MRGLPCQSIEEASVGSGEELPADAAKEAVYGPTLLSSVAKTARLDLQGVQSESASGNRGATVGASGKGARSTAGRA